jgi:hypothetical protein
MTNVLTELRLRYDCRSRVIPPRLAVKKSLKWNVEERITIIDFEMMKIAMFWYVPLLFRYLAPPTIG